MRAGRLAGRVVPALVFCAGSAAAGPLSPPLTPVPAAPAAATPVTVLPPVVLSPVDAPPPRAVEPGPLVPPPAVLPPGPLVPPPGPKPPLVPPPPAMPGPEPLAGPTPPPADSSTPRPVITVSPTPVLTSDVVGGPEPAPADDSGYAWGRAEYLLWAMTGSRVPPLLTTGPLTPPIGAPGAPGTAVLFGGDNQLDRYRSGARATIGTWIDGARLVGWEVTGFWLARVSQDARAGSFDGSGVIGTSPFIDALTGLPTATPISFPGVAAGFTQVSHLGSDVWGLETAARVLLTAGPGWRLDGLLGYRYRSFDENLSIQNTLVPIGTPPGTNFLFGDQIHTSNVFQGGLVGVDLQADVWGWTVSARPSVGIGYLNTSVTRTGTTAINLPAGVNFVFPGGNYNLATNLGTLNTHQCTAIPELDVRVSKLVTSCVRLTVGYSAIYFPGVARAAEQIDPVVNPNLIPPPIPGGPPRPYPFLDRNPAWLQGFSAGVEVRF